MMRVNFLIVFSFFFALSCQYKTATSSNNAPCLYEVMDSVIKINSVDENTFLTIVEIEPTFGMAKYKVSSDKHLSIYIVPELDSVYYYRSHIVLHFSGSKEGEVRINKFLDDDSLAKILYCNKSLISPWFFALFSKQRKDNSLYCPRTIELQVGKYECRSFHTDDAFKLDESEPALQFTLDEK